MLIDFTNCELNKFKVYGGANGSKRGVLYNGETYMLWQSFQGKFKNYNINTKLNKSRYQD